MNAMRGLLAGLVMVAFAGWATGCVDYDPSPSGDLNGDGRVDVQDLAALQAILDQGGGDLAGDLNGDGRVDAADLAVLEGIVCELLGGLIADDGRCCTTAADGTVCCDEELDGTFSECDPPPLTCRGTADCQALNCQAYCGSDEQCHCVDMCADDEDCQVLNCPAFCNAERRCECKVPCQTDEPCMTIQHCPSVCDEAAGHCVCEPNCVEAGERAVNLTPAQTPCCEGLAAREYTPYDPAGGGCVSFDALVTVCVACGDGICGAGEDPCICAEDCGECVPGGVRPYACADGTSVPWCTCGADGRWECVGSPELQCQSDCHGLGDRFVDFDGAQRCCEGLEKMTDSMPMVVQGELTCDSFDCLCYVCLPCGDDVCGPEENFCTCGADCPVPECVPGETQPCACGNHLAEEPGCYSCGQDGRWYPIEWFADPCLCHASPAGCAEGFVCQPADGQCVVDCRNTNCSGLPDAATCDASPMCTAACTGICDCTCPGPYGAEGCGCEGCDASCFIFQACLMDGVCGDGQCDPQTGLCVEPGCVAEGGQFEDPDTEGKCCAGLTPIPFTVLDDVTLACMGVNCPCFVCARCGDGTCGQGETRCNCPGDCVGSEGCDAVSCPQVARSYWVSGDCLAGTAPPELPIPVAQTGCSLAFEQVAADVLGAGGCIDHETIYTASGCTGTVNPIMASITMYFTCPRADGSVCTLFMDDGID
ncbi:MAG TPA: dockerin type I repeat-containing protein [Myxococcota bacterium]|nr:dockerin type I repeat-containing protein [Myxococcota bacterium]HRY95904.1 dockerin type I repeat-containing protein [Myxococcota bacterium]